MCKRILARKKIQVYSLLRPGRSDVNTFCRYTLMIQSRRTGGMDDFFGLMFWEPNSLFFTTGSVVLQGV